jgi:hypothetical protein
MCRQLDIDRRKFLLADQADFKVQDVEKRNDNYRLAACLLFKYVYWEESLTRGFTHILSHDKKIFCGVQDRGIFDKPCERYRNVQCNNEIHSRNTHLRLACDIIVIYGSHVSPSILESILFHAFG